MRLLKDVSFAVDGKKVMKVKNEILEVVGLEDVQKMLKNGIAVPAEMQYGGAVVNRFFPKE